MPTISYRRLVLLILLFCTGCGAELPSASEKQEIPLQAGGPVTLRETRELAGTTFSIEVISLEADKAKEAMDAAFAEVERLEGVVSEWQEDSEINTINAADSGTPVMLSPELYGVISRAIWFAEITDGAFDPTYAGCAQFWSISERRRPSPQELASCRQLTGFNKIQLDALSSSIRLGAPGMRIGLGGIGKGYRVDRAAEILESRGINSYVVNGGGDIRVSAGDLHEPWRIEIDHPRAEGGLRGSISLSRGAIATSGDWSWYYDKDGVRYHHIYDPRTGAPARLSVAVTVIAERAIDADALATGLFVLGPERSLDLLERHPGYEALMVGQDLASYQSPGFPAISIKNNGDE